jgi:competence protein ComEC
VVVAFAAGIAAWFVCGNVWQWLSVIAAGLGLAIAAMALFGAEGRFPYLRRALIVTGIAIAAGCALVWGKAALIGAEPIQRPIVTSIEAKVLSREEQPAEQRVRLLLATREPGSGRAIKVRVNLDLERDLPGIDEGATVQLKARLVPPAAPMLPGGYDFARSAWFSGITATGSVLGRSGRCSAICLSTFARTCPAPPVRSPQPLPAVTAARLPRRMMRRCAMPASRTCSRSVGCTSAR